MNRKLLLSFTGLVAVSLFTVTPMLGANEAHEALTQRQQEIREKLASLFDQRDNPFAPLEASMNPFFRMQDEDTEATTDDQFDPGAPMEKLEVPTTDDLLLEELAPTLDIKGIVSRQGQKFIMINQFLTPVGSMVQVEIRGTPRFVRIEEIGFGQVTISLGEAFITMPY